MRYLLSTQCSKYLIASKSSTLLNRIEMAGIEDIAISSITCFELYLMASQSENPKDNTEAVDNFITCFQTIEFIPQDGHNAVSLKDQLLKNGSSIGQMDLMVMSQAQNRSMILISDVWFDIPQSIELKLAVWV